MQARADMEIDWDDLLYIYWSSCGASLVCQCLSIDTDFDVKYC